MAHPVVHFEIIGKDPERLRKYYGDLFGWEFDTSGQVAEEVSEPTNYGFVDPNQDGDASPVPGGIGGGAGYDNQVIFYVGVPDVAAMLQRAQDLGGSHRMGPAQAPGRDLVVAHFADPEGNVVRLAGTA
jgi:predicted enzyme related to lactoylglutathione lyase